MGRLRREYALVCAFEDRIDVAEHLRQAGVRQDDLLAGDDPFAGKRKRQNQPDGMEEDDEE
ncbi:MAG TPA: hypothetical protein VLK84_13985 [Longimicrobium sp.]|nr:hypothetical protein [Longimicrobium sp.]